MLVYTGVFGAEQAERLLWRAGFGPRPGEAAALVARGLDGAGAALVGPGPARLRGHAPARGRRPAARTLRSLGRGSLLVARPDGSHLAAPRRTDDARLARLVCDLER